MSSSTASSYKCVTKFAGLPASEADKERLADYVLFCFPGSGCSSSDYRPWATAVGPRVLVRGISPPGRAQRWREAPVRDVKKDLVLPACDEMARAIEELGDRPYAIFGHSLGAMAAYEAAAEMTRRGLPPVALAVAGRPAPHFSMLIPGEQTLAGDNGPADNAQYLLAVAARYGDDRLTPELAEALADTAPALRSEIWAAEQYVCPKPSGDAARAPLRCPVLAMAGVDEARRVTDAGLREWALHTSGKFLEPLRFPGGHHFVRVRAAEVAATVSGFVCECGDAAADACGSPKGCASARTSYDEEEILCF
eukprot:m51a1_g12363 putative thioesterase (309) ;mRNA; f:578624-580010